MWFRQNTRDIGAPSAAETRMVRTYKHSHSQPGVFGPTCAIPYVKKERSLGGGRLERKKKTPLHVPVPHEETRSRECISLNYFKLKHPQSQIVFSSI